MRDAAEEVSACAASGAYVPKIAVTLGLDQIAEAHELQESGKAIGKILIGFDLPAAPGSVQETVLTQAGNCHVNESPHLCGCIPTLWMHDVDRQGRLFKLAEHDLKVARHKVRANLVVQHARQSPALACGGYGRFVGVALKSSVYRHAEIVGKAPFRGGRALVDAAMR